MLPILLRILAAMPFWHNGPIWYTASSTPNWLIVNFGADRIRCTLQVNDSAASLKYCSIGLGISYDILVGDPGPEDPIDPNLVGNDNRYKDKCHNCHDLQGVGTGG